MPGIPLDRTARDREIESLLEDLRPRFRSVFHRFAIPPTDAEDLLQQTFLAFLNQRPRIQSPEAWLTGTLKNQCRLYWRSRRRNLCEAVDATLLEELATRSNDVGLEPGHLELKHDLDLALGHIPARCRRLLRARYYQGCRGAEAARLTGYRASGVYKLIDRCIAALTRQLASLGFETGARRDD